MDEIELSYQDIIRKLIRSGVLSHGAWFVRGRIHLVHRFKNKYLYD